MEVLNKKDVNNMNIAIEVASMATCARHKVGVIIVGESMEILSSGRNGTARGEKHCCNIFTHGRKQVEHEGEEIFHGEWSEKNEVHAEINAINFLPTNPHSEPKALYSTHSPCEACTTRILWEKMHGKLRQLDTVCFSEPYDGCEEQMERMKKAGINVKRISVCTDHLNYPFL